MSELLLSPYTSGETETLFDQLGIARDAEAVPEKIYWLGSTAVVDADPNGFYKAFETESGAHSSVSVLGSWQHSLRAAFCDAFRGQRVVHCSAARYIRQF